jgi:hypothetical protein
MEDKPWYDDLRAIGSQAKASFDVDLPHAIGQAIRAYSPKDSAVHRYGQEMATAAEERDKENRGDLTGRGAIANTLIKTPRILISNIAPPVLEALAFKYAHLLPDRQRIAAATAVAGGMATQAGAGYQDAADAVLARAEKTARKREQRAEYEMPGAWSEEAIAKEKARTQAHEVPGGFANAAFNVLFPVIRV